MRPKGGHVTVTAEGGVLEIRLPVDVVASLTGGSVASDKSLRARLPKFAGELAGGFTAQLAEPQGSHEPQRVRIVKIILTRTQVIGQTVVELAEPIEVYA